ncbi:MAG: tetraacyldisaccharide 4'-kinase [Cytophagaceae bacterium]
MKYILLPFSLIYKIVTGLRNLLFDVNVLKSSGFPVKLISVGNLSVGGTGKTPHVEYLIELLKAENKLAVLSRGYGRKTKGFILASSISNAEQIGDEPFQYYLKYKNEVAIAVGEERAKAIPILLSKHPDASHIILDDAYQHRYVKRDLNILISDFNKPFFKDYILPVGSLRESRKGAKRADVVIVSKCPVDVSSDQRAEHEKKISGYTKEGVPVFFTKYAYSQPVQFAGPEREVSRNVILVTGIANVEYLLKSLQDHFMIKQHHKFSDHYSFKESDVDRILESSLRNPDCSILTTEKDMVRLIKFKNAFVKAPVYYLPIRVDFFEDEKKNRFNEFIKAGLKI